MTVSSCYNPTPNHKLVDKLLTIAASSLLVAPILASITASDDSDAKFDDNIYLAGNRAPDETRTLTSGGVVRIWHTDQANFFGLPPIPVPRLTAITIIDKEGRTKASIYYKDGVNQWIPGEQYLLMLRNIGESAPSSSGWWFNKAYDHSASAFVGPHHAQWRRYQTGTKEPEEFGDAVSDAKAQP
jgi:hypothetical protein